MKIIITSAESFDQFLFYFFDQFLNVGKHACSTRIDELVLDDT